MAAAWFRTFVDLSFSSPPVCPFSLGVPALSSAWLGAVSHSSFRAFVRYWPLLMCAVSPTSRCLRAAPLCATGLSCCIPPLSSAWPLAIHVFSFRSTLSAAIVQSCCGVHLRLSAGPLAVSFTYFSLLCRARAAVCHWPVLLRSCFLLVAGFGHTYILLLWAAPLCTISYPAAFLFCSRCGRFCRYSYLVLLLQALAVCAFGLSCLFAIRQFCCLPALSSAWPLAVSPCSLLGPRLRVLLACRDAFLLSLLLWAAPLCAFPLSCLHVAFSPLLLPSAASALSLQLQLFHPRLPPGRRLFWLRASRLLPTRFSSLQPALSPPCGRAAAFLVTPPSARRYTP